VASRDTPAACTCDPGLPENARGAQCPQHGILAFMQGADVFDEEATADVVLTREQADEIAEVLISMAVRLPMKYRDHGEALVLLKWRSA